MFYYLCEQCLKITKNVSFEFCISCIFFEFRAKMDQTDDYMERELKYSHFVR